MSAPHITLSPALGAVAAAAGSTALFATYWDDAWHTDIGRDTALIAPHLVLYGSVAVVALVVLGWGLVAVCGTRSLRGALRQPGLLLAGLGSAVTFAAAPLDAFWHDAFGRDAVLWSPPHMLVVLASTTMAIGLLAGVRPTRHGVVEAAVSALVLGSAMMTVLEYDTDVPQFSQVFYLPVLLASGLLSVFIIRALVPRPYSVARSVLLYVTLRLSVIMVLIALGRSTPDIPLAVLGLAVADLPWRGPAARYGATCAAVAALSWIASALGTANMPPGEIGVVAVPVIAVGLALVAATSLRAHSIGAAAAALLAGATTWILAPAPQAIAHDPGQGQHITSVRWSVSGDGRGNIHLEAFTAESTPGLEANEVVARRGGQALTAPLNHVGPGRFTGAIHLPQAGRWFIYIELDRAGETVESWIPIDAQWQGSSSVEREVYVPAGLHSPTTAQIASGAAIYCLGFLLLGLALIQTRRFARGQHTQLQDPVS